MNPVWANELWIGTESTTSNNVTTWTYSKLCEGVQEMNASQNEQNQQYFFLCGEGFAHNEVTGAAPNIVVSGRRIKGNAAQDYIVSKRYALGNDRKTSVKIIAEGDQIVCDATLGEINSFGGQALDVNQFGCTIYFNGKPTVTSATT